jgi:ubiquitin carboxyl-terminal hydrolase 16
VVPAIQTTGAGGIGEEEEEEDGFPMEGRVESQIECLACGFRPRPTESTFCTMTLNVPQVSSTSLNACFDLLLKTEYIDDYKCDKCRLLHAKEVFQAELKRSTSEAFKTRVQDSLEKLQLAIDVDPENPPVDVVLPDSKYAPKRKIAKHTRLTSFPKILAIHLSRSIYDATQASMKNSAKVSFPERLPLGGLLQQRQYKLLGLVTHKGSHHSGHYESFRRQNIYPPYSNTATFQPSGIYSKSATPVSTPQTGRTQHPSRNISPVASTPDLMYAGTGTSSSAPSLASSLPQTPSPHSSPSLNGRPRSASKLGPTSAPRESDKERDPETSSLRSVAASARSKLSKITSPSRSGSQNGGSRHGTLNEIPVAPAPSGAKETAMARPGTASTARPRRRKHHDRWWRISDEKIKEASTREVLGMQREVYLLFYELERDEM